MKFLPPAKNVRWLYWMAAYGVLLLLIFMLHRFLLMGETFNITIMLRFALVAFVVSGILNGLGWLGARLIWTITTIGIVVGLILMFIYSYRDMSGWGDLAAFLTFIICMIGGFALGLLTEVIYLVIGLLRKS